MTNASERWKQAQEAEGEFWTSVSQRDEEIRRVLDDNRALAKQIIARLASKPDRVLEIGIGGLGVGAIAFLGDSRVRVGIDPLPLQDLRCSEALQAEIHALREPVQFELADGESLRMADSSFELVLCCNVLDHVRDPALVIKEAHRVLQPGGFLFLAVDVFSVAGLVKWNMFSRHRYKSELVVRAHPHRLSYSNIRDLIGCAGFQVTYTENRSITERFLGRTQSLSILARK